jgi:hypothetical protein
MSRLISENALYKFSSDSSAFPSATKRHKDYTIYRTITLLFLVYGCETWSVTKREEYRLRVLENRVLREVFGSKRDEVMGRVEKAVKWGASWFVLLAKCY